MIRKEKRLTTKIFEQLSIFQDSAYFENEQNISVLGLIDNKRVYKFLPRKYLQSHDNIDKYKVILPKSNGSGAIGEVLSTPLIGEPLIGEPLIGYTQSFMSFGSFDEVSTAENVLKYIKTKFLRVMLGTLKITQDNNSDTWKNVPMQTFTPTSDIDWSKSISEIDQQLYKKYGLDEKEITFVEEKVKAMD